CYISLFCDIFNCNHKTTPYYPLVAPAVNPVTKYLCKSKNTIEIGIAIIIAPAAKTVKLLPNWSFIKLNNPTANVYFSGLLNKILGNIKSMNGPIKLNSATTANIGLAKGNIIVKNILICPAPSILADSSNSFGIVSKYPFTKNAFIGID